MKWTALIGGRCSFSPYVQLGICFFKVIYTLVASISSFFFFTWNLFFQEIFIQVLWQVEFYDDPPKFLQIGILNRDIIQVRLPFSHKPFKVESFLWLVAGGEVRGLPCLCWHEDVKAHGKNRWPVVSVRWPTWQLARKYRPLNFLFLKVNRIRQMLAETPFSYKTLLV